MTGLVKGESLKDTTGRLRGALQKALKDKQFVQAGGRHYRPEYYAEMVARTRTREAATEGTINRSHELGITLFKVSSHADSCEYCLKFQGQIYSTVKGSGYPMLEERPPYHPNCAHVLMGWVEKPSERRARQGLEIVSSGRDEIKTTVKMKPAGGEGLAEEVVDRDGGLESPIFRRKGSDPEPVPQTIENRFDAAKRLGLEGVRHKDIEQVRQAIRKQDYESSFAWGADGTLVAARDGEKRRVSLLEEEWASLRDGVAIHNHPGGNTFSPKDLWRAKEFGLARMEVLTKDCCFMLQPPDGGWKNIDNKLWRKWYYWLEKNKNTIVSRRKSGIISTKEAEEKFASIVSKFCEKTHIRYMKIEG